MQRSRSTRLVPRPDGTGAAKTAQTRLLSGTFVVERDVEKEAILRKALADYDQMVEETRRKPTTPCTRRCPLSRPPSRTGKRKSEPSRDSRAMTRASAASHGWALSNSGAAPRSTSNA